MLQEFERSVEERRGGQRELDGQRRAQLAREVGHLRDIGDAAPVNPAEDLARVEARVPALFEGGLERRAFQVGEVGSSLRGGHGISLVSRCLRG